MINCSLFYGGGYNPPLWLLSFAFLFLWSDEVD
nr:MAG TPA: hypothetical protein [Caudoviricetes sp.]